LRVLAYRHNYGLIAAGSIGRTLIGKLPAKSRQIGPVAAISFRVASRIANSIKAGRAVRGVADLDDSSVILFHAPPGQMRLLLHLCFTSAFDWRGRTLIFCDCDPPSAALTQLHGLGAATAVARAFIVPGFATLQGSPPALPAARKMVRDVGLRPLEIAHDRAPVFSAAITLGTAALTPLIDRTSYLLRCAGIRDSDSIKLAELLFQQTARGYGHSGRQSWVWHIGAPCADELESEVDALDSDLGCLLRRLLLLGFDTFEKHPEIANSIRRQPNW
jgi:hypothetical protein